MNFSTYPCSGCNNYLKSFSIEDFCWFHSLPSLLNWISRQSVKLGLCCRFGKYFVDKLQKENFQWYVATLRMCIQFFYQGILFRSVLLLHKTTWFWMVCWGYTLLYTSKVLQASKHTINKFSSLIIYLDFEATMTTHKLIKKRSYVKAVLFLIGLASDHLVK